MLSAACHLPHHVASGFDALPVPTARATRTVATRAFERDILNKAQWCRGPSLSRAIAINLRVCEVQKQELRIALAEEAQKEPP
jgi:hypothetical protein